MRLTFQRRTSGHPGHGVVATGRGSAMRLLRLLTPVVVPLTGLALVTGGVTTARATAAAPAGPAHVEGALASGATYVMDVPARWNGTVVLYSHGYRPAGAPNPAENAPGAGTRDALLADGYALVGSSYAVTGWSLAEAVPEQLATLAEFRRRFGHARRTLAWGTSDRKSVV